MSKVGRLQLFFDGQRKPRVDVLAADFFAGRVPGFPKPLVGDSAASSGGHYSYVPFCFQRSLKVRLTAVPPDERLWYQLTALVLPHGSAVRSYARRELMSGRAAASLAAAGRPPAGRGKLAQRWIAPGETMLAVSRRGSGSIRYLRFGVAPFLPDTLSKLELRITANGARRPQVKVPLGDLFGDGFSIRLIRSRAFGMDPVARRGYFSLQIPFRSGVKVALASRTSARVQVKSWLGPPLRSAGVFYGRRRVERSRLGLDATVLAARGSGRLAAWVLDAVGAPGGDRGPVRSFLEGDERVRVDRSRSPTIHGTGTEDAFNGGFYYFRGPFSQPTHGAGYLLSRPDIRGAQSQYRVFGGDGFLWEQDLRFDIEHGGGDEAKDVITASTAFWYAGRDRLRRTDRLLPAERRSARAHRLRGRFERRRLSAYFEGERDGNGTQSPHSGLGGTAYPAPPPSDSREGVTTRGVALRGPLSFDLRLGRRNCGVILRRLLDAGEASRVAVSVNGRRVGPWLVAEANPAKRWRDDDFALHSKYTAGRRRIRVTLTPSGDMAATAFRIDALARTQSRCEWTQP